MRLSLQAFIHGGLFLRHVQALLLLAQEMPTADPPLRSPQAWTTLLYPLARTSSPCDRCSSASPRLARRGAAQVPHGRVLGHSDYDITPDDNGAKVFTGAFADLSSGSDQLHLCCKTLRLKTEGEYGWSMDLSDKTPCSAAASSRAMW